MRSALPKVLHPLAGQPLLSHVLDTARTLRPTRLHVVVGHGAEAVRTACAGDDIDWVLQSEQLGTGHAVLQALPAIPDDATVLVLYGDVPLLRPETLRRWWPRPRRCSPPSSMTRRVTGACCATNYEQLRGVVEHKDASAAQREIREVNTGVLAYPAALLNEYLPRVGNANAQGEYYLPDVLAMAVENGHGVAALRTLRTPRLPWVSTTAASWPRRSASCTARIAVR
jgi:bifunctional UDP-N-acetylglucosamine pyrophosphorylase/glucosamine-1-phosphate N-acetyltransferase